MNNSSIAPQFFSRIKIGPEDDRTSDYSKFTHILEYGIEFCQFAPSENQETRECLIKLENLIMSLSETFSEEDLEATARLTLSIDVALDSGDVSNYRDFTETLIKKCSNKGAWDAYLEKLLMSQRTLHNLVTKIEFLKYPTSPLKLNMTITYFMPRFTHLDVAELRQLKRDISELCFRDAFLKICLLSDGSYIVVY